MRHDDALWEFAKSSVGATTDGKEIDLAPRTSDQAG